MRTIKIDSKNEIFINKSRFISYLVKIYDENDVKGILLNIKKGHKDATHYCYAYIIDNLKRYSDDGEPSGTAGIPIMNVLTKKACNYLLCVVVRYFGGIKLGVGGLLRAYSKCVTEALKKSVLVDLVKAIRISITCSFDVSKSVDYILKNSIIISKKYNDKIMYEADVKKEEYDNILKQLKLLNNIHIDELGDGYIEE
jgi:uncharacterized YigZ family protein